jgi:hypothetical protein
LIRYPVPFLRFPGVLIHLFADDSLCGFIQVFIQHLFDFQKFRPEHAVDKRSGNPHHQAGISLAPVTIGFHPVPAAQRHEQPPLPSIGQGKPHFHGLLAFLLGSKRRFHAIDGGRRRIALTMGVCAFEEGINLPQLFAQFGFACHSVCLALQLYIRRVPI